MAALVEVDGEEELARRDYSLEAWEKIKGVGGGGGGGGGGAAEGLGPGERVFASWRAVVGEQGKPERLLVDDDSLMDLFEQLEGQTEPKRAAFRFVLALLLVRKRLLILDRAERDRLLVRFKGEDKDAQPTVVVDPGLDEQTLSEVESQLEAVIRQ